MPSTANNMEHAVLDGESELDASFQHQTEPQTPLGKRIFRSILFLSLVATGLLIAHHRHPTMKGVFMGPSPDGKAGAPAKPLQAAP